MKKHIIYISCIFLIVLICLSAIPTFAADTEQDTILESAEEITEVQSSEETTIEESTEPFEDSTAVQIETGDTTAANIGVIEQSSATQIEDGEIAEDIIDIVENAENKGQAILKLAEKLGITQEEAESLIDSFITLGDEYLGETSFWVAFKTDLQENMQFWAAVIVCIIAVLAIVAGIFVLLAKTNPTMRRAMLGMTDTLKITKESAATNSQALGEMQAEYKAFIMEMKERDRLHQAIIQEKEEYVKVLTEHLSEVEDRSETERKNMLIAFANNLRILKLICDRTPLPVADKATIDLFCAKATQALETGLTEEDVRQIEETFAMLDSVGG